MKLKIKTLPVVGPLAFYTKKSESAESDSPRTILRQRGLEFDHYRAYQQGDDASLIDWKASARSNDILVKVYTEDMSLKIAVLVDVSSSMIYGTSTRTKIETAIEIAINITYGCIEYGDSVGMMMFNQEVAGIVNFGHQMNDFAHISHELMDTSKFGGEVHFQYALQSAARLLKGMHLMIIISDFLGIGEEFFYDMNAMLDQCDIIGIMVYDKTDIALDAKIPYFALADPFSGQGAMIKTKKVAKLYRQENERRINKLQEYFEAAGKDLWIFNTEDSIKDKLPRLLMERNEVRK